MMANIQQFPVQVHLKERMLALEEKNNLSNELQSTKKRLEEIGNQKVGETFTGLAWSISSVIFNIYNGEKTFLFILFIESN